MQLVFKVLNIFLMTCDQNRDCRMRKKHRQTCFEICLGLSTNRNKRRLAWSDLLLYVYVDAKMYVIVKICLVFD